MLTMPPRIRLVPGPQIDHFSEDEIAAFFGHTFVVGASDRMGMRLVGRRIAHRQGFDIVSDGIAPGSIQILGDGQPVILLADRHTTGGYPKIATVISSDIPALGRVPVGGKVSFEPVTIEAAEAARRTHFSELALISDYIVPLHRSAAEVAARLFDCNLISGVVDAAV